MIEHPRAFAVTLAITSACVAMFGATVGLLVAAHANAGHLVGTLLPTGSLLAFVFVGGLIAARRPDNAIGWVCLTSGTFWSFVFVSEAYNEFGREVLHHPGPLADWLNLVAGWVPAVGLLATFMLLLFPDGHLPSPRWRVVAWTSGVMIVLLHLVIVFSPENEGDPLPDVPNFLDGLRPALMKLAPLIVLFPICAIASAISLVFRHRRASPEDRVKLRWIAFAGVVVVAFYALTFALSLSKDWGGANEPTWLAVMQNANLVTFSFIPIAVGIAVLRYRLYDIDRLISRTLSYAVVTVVLAGTYALVVLGPLSLIGSGRRPQWLVAVGTLAAAALFSPVRRRVQTAVDHRFDRHHYDAARTIDAFAARMRRQVDLDDLGAELTGIVSQTMQPAHLSLWLPTRTFVRSDLSRGRP